MASVEIIGDDRCFEWELAALINKYSQENGSNTPDFLLAEYMTGCLAVWNRTVRKRQAWYGRATGDESSPSTD